MVCKFCGSLIDINQVECPSCGARIAKKPIEKQNIQQNNNSFPPKKKIVCKYCGSKLESENALCSSCGAIPVKKVEVNAEVHKQEIEVITPSAVDNTKTVKESSVTHVTPQTVVDNTRSKESKTKENNGIKLIIFSVLFMIIGFGGLYILSEIGVFDTNKPEYQELNNTKIENERTEQTKQKFALIKASNCEIPDGYTEMLVGEWLTNFFSLAELSGKGVLIDSNHLNSEDKLAIEEAEKYLCNNFNVHDREIYSTTIYKNSMNGGPGWMIFSQFSEYSKSFEHAVLRVYDLANTDIENGE